MSTTSDIARIPDIIRFWSAERPDKVALIQGEAHRTYAELDRRSNRIANRIIAAGAPRGSHISYVGRNSIEVFEIWFGAAKAACAFAPLNWRCPVEELIVLIEDAKPPLVFATSEFEERLRAVRERCKHAFALVVFEGDGALDDGLARWISGCAATDPEAPVGAQDTALLSYTSGTTGRPKGVQASQAAFAASFQLGALEPSMAWRGDDIMLMSMPNFHLAGSWVSLAALYNGATLSILPAFEPQAFMQALRRDRPTIAPLVPAAMQMLLAFPDLEASDFISLRSVMYFGSPVAADLARKAIEVFGCELNQFYGTTEIWFASVLRHDQHLPGEGLRLASCGVPLPGVSMKIVDPAGGEVAAGIVGELLVRSPTVFSGYLDRPDATAEVLREGWYHTGDLGRKDEDGFVYLVDRAKDMIITGGENVFSVEVEAVLQKHPAVMMVAVIGTPDAKWGEKVTALVVLSPGGEATEAELKQFCRQFLPGYKIPKTILFEDALPMTPSGKVQKAELRKRFRTEAAEPAA